MCACVCVRAEREGRRKTVMERKILVKANSEHLFRGFPKSCKYSTEYQPTDRKSLDWNSPFFLLFMGNLPPRLVVVFPFIIYYS